MKVVHVDKVCLAIVIVQLVVLCFFAYRLGIDSEKIGWLEQQILDKQEVTHG